MIDDLMRVFERLGDDDARLAVIDWRGTLRFFSVKELSEVIPWSEEVLRTSEQCSVIANPVSYRLYCSSRNAKSKLDRLEKSVSHHLVTNVLRLSLSSFREAENATRNLVSDLEATYGFAVKRAAHVVFHTQRQSRLQWEKNQDALETLACGFGKLARPFEPHGRIPLYETCERTALFKREKMFVTGSDDRIDPTVLSERLAAFLTETADREPLTATGGKK